MYNVGGLSLVNAVAGAYAELVPMIVIGGAPSTSQQRQKLFLHHTAVDYNLQLEIFEKTTVAATQNYQSYSSSYSDKSHYIYLFARAQTSLY